MVSPSDDGVLKIYKLAGHMDGEDLTCFACNYLVPVSEAL
jgi:hypothetical protein